ncbi:MAG: hypothetical protein GX102_10180 [Porphyromonadaceae bacterium]|nr:hypothetical protein [Porphyromonadaceae bacterium]
MSKDKTNILDNNIWLNSRFFVTWEGSLQRKKRLFLEVFTENLNENDASQLEKSYPDTFL